MIANYKRILKWVNSERLKMHKQPITELPKGIPEDPTYCPIAEGLSGATVGRSDWRYLGDDTPFNHRQLPDYVIKFIDRFDNGKYPSLILETPEEMQDAVVK